MKKSYNAFGIIIKKDLLAKGDKQYLDTIFIYLLCWGKDFEKIFFNNDYS